jgi:hypothetical protein
MKNLSKNHKNPQPVGTKQFNLKINDAKQDRIQGEFDPLPE